MEQAQLVAACPRLNLPPDTTRLAPWTVHFKKKDSLPKEGHHLILAPIKISGTVPDNAEKCYKGIDEKESNK